MPHSRWEEDSEEEAEENDKYSDSVKNDGGDPLKRTDSAIFRRAISAIKPKQIEIKLRPERRVLLDSSAPEKGELMDVTNELTGVADQMVKVGTTTVTPKFNPALDLKLDVDEKKKSIRDRLGEKIEPDQPPVRDKADDTKEKDKSKKDANKKDKRSSPAKEKVFNCCVSFNGIVSLTFFF